MELVKKLEESCREVLKGVHSMEMKERVLGGSVEALEAKKASLEQSVSSLEEKRKKIEAEVQEEKSSQLAEIDKLRDSLVKKEKDVNDRIVYNTVKASELEKATKKMQESKDNFDTLAVEYEGKLAEIKEKKERLAAVLG